MAESVGRQLLFEIGGHLFAIEVREIREVVEPCPATPVPGSDPGILGLVNLRGTLATAADLAALLGVEPGRRDAAAMVVLERQGRCVALLIDLLVGIVPGGEEGLDVGGDLLEALGDRGLAVGVGEFGPRPYVLLDPEAIHERVLADEGERSLQDASRGGGGGT